MADEKVEWVLVKHVRFPIPYDGVVGRYISEEDAQRAHQSILDNPQWFTTYAVEKRKAS